MAKDQSQLIPFPSKIDWTTAFSGTGVNFDTSLNGRVQADALTKLYPTGGIPSDIASAYAGDVNTAVTPSTSGDAGGSATSALPASTSVLGGISDWFTRAVVIILGFIFVAVGLAMFRDPGKTVVQIAKGAAN